MPEANDKCGIAAVHLKKPDGHPRGSAAYYLMRMLVQQQHRGQLSAGITTYNPERQILLQTKRGLGTVSEAFHLSHTAKRNAILDRYAGTSGIGHVRYATCGLNELSHVQPFERQHGRMWKWFSFAFNGNIANYSELRDKLRAQKYHLVREVDTETIMHFLSKQMLGEEEADIVNMFSNISTLFDGAYNLVYINAAGKLVAVRDPHGFRPISYFSEDEMTAVASETCAFTNLANNGTQSLKPGHMLIVDNDSVEVKQYAKCNKCAHCMFEWVYFANPSSVIEGKSVYEARYDLGKELAKVEPLEVNSDEYIVGPVPDTAIPFAHALAHELGIPTMEALIRNRYIGRTFIEGRDDRMARVKEKYTVNKAIVKGKKLILVEDSIVRGTTSRALLEYIRRVGKPKEIHLRVSCPPIKYPCFYGIDMSTMTELIAPKHMSKDEIYATGVDVSEKVIEAIRKEIGADSLVYLPHASLVKGIGLEGGARDLCMACLTGEYATPWGRNLAEKAKEAATKKGKGKAKGKADSCKRTYE